MRVRSAVTSSARPVGRRRAHARLDEAGADRGQRRLDVADLLVELRPPRLQHVDDRELLAERVAGPARRGLVAAAHVVDVDRAEVEVDDGGAAGDLDQVVGERAHLRPEAVVDRRQLRQRLVDAALLAQGLGHAQAQVAGDAVELAAARQLPLPRARRPGAARSRGRSRSRPPAARRRARSPPRSTARRARSPARAGPGPRRSAAASRRGRRRARRCGPSAPDRPRGAQGYPLAIGLRGPAYAPSARVVDTVEPDSLEGRVPYGTHVKEGSARCRRSARWKSSSSSSSRCWSSVRRSCRSSGRAWVAACATSSAACRATTTTTTTTSASASVSAAAARTPRPPRSHLRRARRRAERRRVHAAAAARRRARPDPDRRRERRRDRGRGARRRARAALRRAAPAYA